MTQEPELHQIVEALIFASPEGISTVDIVRAIRRAATPDGEEPAPLEETVSDGTRAQKAGTAEKRSRKKKAAVSDEKSDATSAPEATESAPAPTPEAESTTEDPATAEEFTSPPPAPLDLENEVFPDEIDPPTIVAPVFQPIEDPLYGQLRGHLLDLREKLGLEDEAFGILADYLGDVNGKLGIESEYADLMASRLRFNDQQRQIFAEAVQIVEKFPEPQAADDQEKMLCAADPDREPAEGSESSDEEPLDDDSVFVTKEESESNEAPTSEAPSPAPPTTKDQTTEPVALHPDDSTENDSAEQEKSEPSADESIVSGDEAPESPEAIESAADESGSSPTSNEPEPEPEPAVAALPTSVPALPIRFRKVTEAEVLKAIDLLNAQYADMGRAFFLDERSTGWRILTRPTYGPWVRALFPDRKPQRLSPPMLETLAIIAYRQPITRAAIEAVRGVSIDGPIQKLLDHNLIRIAGRADLPGRPLLYETTDLFLEHFGIKSVDDLPNAAELRRIELPKPDEEKETQPEATQPELPLS